VKLADKLQKIGVKCRMPKWFHSLITQCFWATRVEKEASKYKQSRRGLLQGAVTSTTDFSDVPIQLGEIKNVKSALFADDLVIWTSLLKHL
jgi:hypothetical protein